MASSRQRYVITDDLITRLEGLLQALRETAAKNPRLLPAVALPQRYLEAELSIPIRVLKSWLQEARNPVAREEYKLFAELHSAIASVFSSKYENTLHTIATDPTNRHAITAATKLLEKIGDPMWSGEETQVEEAIGNVPAELLHYASAEEIDALILRETAMHEQELKDRQFIDRLRARRMSEKVSDLDDE